MQTTGLSQTKAARRPVGPAAMPTTAPACDSLGRFGLRLVWQPIQSAGSAPLGGPIRREALLRQPASTGSDCFPIATVSALRLRTSPRWLDACVLEAACAEAAAWNDEVVAAVNVAPDSLCDMEFAARVEAALAAAKLPPHRLQIEITEESVPRCLAAASASVRRVRGLGATVALDDFGAGPSSWTTLQALPVDTLKLDGRFTRHLEQGERGERSRIILGGIVRMAHALGMTVCAECVETPEQLRIVRELGCDEVQGYLIGRPTPIAGATASARRDA